MGSISLKYKSKSGNLTAPGDVDPGAMIPIATTVVGAGGASTVTFSSIPQNYEHLQVRAIARTDRTPTAYDYPVIRFNSDTGSNYGIHYLEGDGSSVIAGAATSLSSIYLNEITSNGASASIFGTFIVDILDYINTNKYTTTRVLGGYDKNGSGVMIYRSGLWLNTAAITTLTITPLTGPNFVQYSSFALYGIKRAGA
jgi:hypothetical protein